MPLPARTRLTGDSLVRKGDKVLLIYRPSTLLRFIIEDAPAIKNFGSIPGVPIGVNIPDKLRRKVLIQNYLREKIAATGKFRPIGVQYVEDEGVIKATAEVIVNPVWLVIVGAIIAIPIGIGVLDASVRTTIDWIDQQVLRLDSAWVLNPQNLSDADRQELPTDAVEDLIEPETSPFLARVFDPLQDVFSSASRAAVLIIAALILFLIVTR